MANGIRETLDGMATRPGRTVLTGVGVAMVTAATVAGVTIGRTNQGAVANAFVSTASGFVTIRQPQESDRAMTVTDVARASTTPDVMATASAARLRGPMTTAHLFEASTQGVDVMLVTGDIAAAAGLDITNGTTFDTGHLTRSDQVAVVGAGAASQLELGPVDGTNVIIINERPFTVLGSFDVATGDPSLVSNILVPRGALGTNGPNVDIVYALTEPVDVATHASLLAARLAPNDYQNLEVSYDAGNPGLGSRVIGEVEALTAGLLIIGSLVAVVVVGSLASASVSERRREIAVRKALGATSSGIGVRFVAEAALVGVGGASAGVLIGLGLAGAVAQIRDWTLLVDPAIVWIALTQGVVASMLGASVPAIRAARLDPAEALSRS